MIHKLETPLVILFTEMADIIGYCQHLLLLEYPNCAPDVESIFEDYQEALDEFSSDIDRIRGQILPSKES